MKINSVSELPEWFNLTNYSPVSSFNARDWLTQLTLRSLVTNSLLIMNEGDSPLPETGDVRTTEIIYRKELTEILHHIRRDPVVCKAEENFYWTTTESLTDQDHLSFSAAVRPLTISDVVAQRNLDEFAAEDGLINKSQIEFWQLLNKDLTDHDDDHFDDSEIIICRRMPNTWPEPAILIDLNAPDTIILSTFKDWLKKQRDKTPTGVPTPRKPAFDWWSRYGLLPYLDLMAWSLETRSHIPDRVMAEAISDFNGGEDRLRKTIKPLAGDLIKLIQGLEEIVAAEFSA